MKDMINEICKRLPEGYQINLHMEEGAAYVTIINDDFQYLHNVDGGDKTLEEQLEESLYHVIRMVRNKLNPIEGI